MVSQSISRAIIAIVKLVSLIAMAIIIMGCPPEPATPGDGGGNGDGNGGGNGGGGLDRFGNSRQSGRRFPDTGRSRFRGTHRAARPA